MQRWLSLTAVKEMSIKRRPTLASHSLSRSSSRAERSFLAAERRRAEPCLRVGSFRLRTSRRDRIHNVRNTSARKGSNHCCRAVTLRKCTNWRDHLAHREYYHVFETRSFMPCSAASCQSSFRAHREMSLIVGLFLVGAVGIEPTTSPVLKGALSRRARPGPQPHFERTLITKGGSLW